MSEQPRLLPLIGPAAHSGRSAMTCQYRCGNACDHPVPNKSDNPYFGTWSTPRCPAAASCARAPSARSSSASPAPRRPPPRPTARGRGSAGPAAPPAQPSARRAGARTGDGALTFKPIPPNKLDTFIVPERVRPRGGDPLGRPGAARRARVRRRTTRPARAQSKQFGYNNDFVGVLPLDRRGRPGAARGQPRVHQRGADVPRLHQPRRAHRGPGRGGHRRARPVRGGDRAGRRHRAVGGRSARGRRSYNRRITALSTSVRVHRSGRRLGAAEDGGRPARPHGRSAR